MYKNEKTGVIVKFITPIIDMHTHLWSDRTGLRVRAGNAETLIDLLNRYDIRAMAVSPLFGGTSC